MAVSISIDKDSSVAPDFRKLSQGSSNSSIRPELHGKPSAPLWPKIACGVKLQT